MNYHDRAYKQLFQHKLLLQLLFTPEMLGPEWVGLLDFNQAKLLPTEHLSAKLDLRQNDQIWRIKRLDSRDDLYVLLLLEFQSSVEPKMALRISTYVTLLYEQLLNQRQVRLKDGLPVVLPVVLYTGLTSKHNNCCANSTNTSRPIVNYVPRCCRGCVTCIFPAWLRN